MIEIKTSKIEQMSASAQNEFLCLSDEAVEKCETIKTEMSVVYEPWRVAVAAMKEAYSKPYKQEETEEIHCLVGVRYNFLSGNKSVAIGYSHMPDPNDSAAGIGVLQAYKSFPVNPNADYLSENAMADALITNLSISHQANMEHMNMLQLFNKIVEINNRIHELIIDREESADERPERPLTRLACVQAYLDLAKFVNAYLLVVIGKNGTVPADLALYVTTQNGIVDRFLSVVLRDPNKKPGESEVLPGETPDQTPGAGETPGQTPGAGGGTDQTPGAGEGEHAEHEARFMHEGTLVATQRYRTGETIVPPTPPTNYVWADCPATMPDHDITVVTEWDINQPPPGTGGSGFE